MIQITARSKYPGVSPPSSRPAVWLGRLAADEVGVSMMTRYRSTSNANANAQLGWAPRYPTYREGVRTGLGDVPVPDSDRCRTDNRSGR